MRDDVPQAAKGAEMVKRVLSNLATIVQGVAELRGLYGTGHGKDGKARGLQPRHARLAVGAELAGNVRFSDLHRDKSGCGGVIEIDDAAEHAL